MAYQYDIAPVREAFEAYIDTDIPNTTGDFHICCDYTLHGNEWTEYPKIRAMTSVINWKSNVGGSDSVHNIRTKLSADIHRGDYVYDPTSGTVGLITYFIDNMPDCKRTQVSTCNAQVEVYRDVAENIDPETGMLIAEATTETVVHKCPAFYSSMYGRFLYELGNNVPGIMPDQKIELRVQWNNETKNLASGDRFVLRGIEHRVMFITYDYLDMNDEHGFIVLTCERVE